MGARDQHVGSIRMVGDRGWVGNTLVMDRFVAVIGEIVHHIARVCVERGETLGVGGMVSQVVWHLGFVSDGGIIVGSRGMVCRLS